MRNSSDSSLRRTHGGAMLKLVVWLAIGFAGYCGMKALSISSTAQQVERELGMALSRVGYGGDLDAVAEVLARKASNSHVRLTPDDVHITMDRAEGVRIITADVEFPLGIDFLGGERSVRRHVSVTREIHVDEKALAMAEARESARLARYEAQQAEARVFTAEVDEAFAECEAKHGKGNCQLTDMGGGGGENRLYKHF